jgi:hypothetical protein
MLLLCPQYYESNQTYSVLLPEEQGGHEASVFLALFWGFPLLSAVLCGQFYPVFTIILQGRRYIPLEVKRQDKERRGESSKIAVNKGL